MKNYNTIIFDLDGTLSNSKEGITKSVQYALKKMNIEVDDLDSLEHFIGPPLADEFIRTYGFSMEEALRGKEYYRERYIPTGLYEAEIYPGTEEMLQSLKNTGKKLAIATSKPLTMAIDVLKYLKIEQYFDYIMGAQVHGKRQSKEAVLEELFNIHPEIIKDECVMIGDTKFDIEGANALGLDSIGVEYGFGSNEEMLNLGAIIIAKDTSDLTDILLNQ